METSLLCPPGHTPAFFCHTMYHVLLALLRTRRHCAAGGGKAYLYLAATLPDVQAPVETGQLLGRVVVHIEGSKLCEYDLVAADAVDRMTAPRALCMLLRALVQL